MPAVNPNPSREGAGEKIRRLIANSRLAFAGAALLAAFPLPAAIAEAPVTRTVAGPFAMEVRFDADRINTAGTFLAEVAVIAPIEATLVSLEPLVPTDAGTRVETLETAPPRAISPAELRHEGHYRLYPFLPGAYSIGAFRATLAFEEKEFVLESEPIPVVVESVIDEDHEAAALAELVPYPDHTNDSSGRLGFGAALLGAGALAALALLAFATRRRWIASHGKGAAR